MRMFGIILRGLRGRKRDSITLGMVLLLSFLFLVASSIVLSSVAFTAQQQRQALYGNWQAMYHDVRREDLTAYQGLEGVSVMHLLGETNEGRTIASINEDVVAAGNLQLVEGRLPENENEIVIVQGRMGDELAVGDNLYLQLDYDYMERYIDSESDIQREQIKIALQTPRTVELDGETIELTWEKAHEEFVAYINTNFNVETGTLVIGDPDTPYSSVEFQFENCESAEQLLSMDEWHDILLQYWAIYVYAIQYFDGSPGWMYAIADSDLNVNHPDGAGGFLIRVEYGYRKFALDGPAYAPGQRGTAVYSDYYVYNVSLYRDYTVVGVIAPYADHWDVNGYTMPDAFVSEVGLDSFEQAIDRAQSYYHEGAPAHEYTAILLQWLPNRSLRTAAMPLLEVYNTHLRPQIRLRGFKGTDETSELTGSITGVDPQTGEVTEYPAVYRDGMYFIVRTDGEYALDMDPTDPAQFEYFADRLLPLQPESATVDSLYDDNTGALRLNSFAYPAAGGTEESLQTLLSGVLVGVVACATFQIFWVQLRRRKARLATLMSIGATDGQIFGMLMLEILLLLLIAGVLGVTLGFGTAHVLLKTVVNATYHPDWQHLLTGLVCAAAAVFAGSLVPMLLALKTPLTGREQVAERVLRLKTPRENIKFQSYGRIVLRSAFVNRGRTALQFVFAWLLATICLLTVFLCHNAFDGYRREVEDVDRPDYELKLPYAMSRSFLRTSLEQKLYNGDCSAVVEGGNVRLRCESLLSESPILQKLYDIQQRDLSPGEEMFLSLPENGLGYATRVIGAPQGSVLLQQIMDLIPPGVATEEEILNGEACVLLVPRYFAAGDSVAERDEDPSVVEDLDLDERSGALLELSYDPTMSAMTQVDEAVQPGDEIRLWAESQKQADMTTIITSEELSVRVAAVVSVMDTPIWPYIDNEAAYWVLSGDRLIYKLYPYSGTRREANQVQYMELLIEAIAPDCYGHTVFYLTNPEGSDGIAQDTAAANFAEAYGMDFSNLRLLNERVYSDAVKSSMMFLLLGVEMALVVLTILIATAASAVAQDRWRYGTLQAIGVSGGQLAWGQILQALGVGLFGCVAANLTLALVICLSAAITAIGQAAYWPMLLRGIVQSLSGYPWAVHGILCAAYLIVYVFAQSRPIFRVSRADPIDNIRS